MSKSKKLTKTAGEAFEKAIVEPWSAGQICQVSRATHKGREYVFWTDGSFPTAENPVDWRSVRK